MKTLSRCIFYLSLLLTVSEAAYSQGSCNGITVANPVLRAEGQAELSGALIIVCSGVTTGQAVDLDLSVNAASIPITSRSGEVIVTVTQAGAAAVFSGTPVPLNGQSTSSVIRFARIAITDSAPTFLISGIRVNVSSTYLPLAGLPYGQVFANVSASTGVLPIVEDDAGFPVGIVLASFSAFTLSSAPNVDPCQANVTLDPASAFTFAVKTNFPGAFKTQGFSGVPPGSVDSESGLNPSEPQADSATQFAVTLGGSLPAQLSFYLPATITSDTGGVAQLVTTEGGTTLLSPSASTVLAVTGSTYFYNVFTSDPTTQQTFSLSLTTDPANAVTFAVSDFAPLFTINMAPLAADLVANAPRFQGNSLPINFSFATVACQDPQAPAKLHGIRITVH